jgi:hypothetical protein
MPNLFVRYELPLLLRLLEAHLLADFVFQTDSLVQQRLRKKWASPWLYTHGVISAVTVYVLAGYWGALWLPLIIFITHTLLDGLKVSRRDTSGTFLWDQLGHLAVVVGCWALLISFSVPTYSGILGALGSNVILWTLILSYSIIYWPAGIWIGKFTAPWREHIGDRNRQGLEKAGLWIGRLERILILTFVLLDHYEAIGFLIAAKSVFRFGEIRDPAHRKEAEYILIGTLTSFTLTIVLGIIVHWVLQHAW